MKKLTAFILTLVLVCTFMAACGKKEKDNTLGNNTADTQMEQYPAEDVNKVIDAFWEIYAELDSNAGEYIATLDKAAKYNSGEMSKEEILAVLEEKIGYFTAKKESFTEYTISDELYDSLEACDIIANEFKIVGNSVSDQLTEYIENFENLVLYIGGAENYTIYPEDAPFWTDFNTRIYNTNKGYYFYGYINYVFAEFDEKNTALVKEKIISQIKNLIVENYEWQTTKAGAEAKTNSALDEFEQILDEVTPYYAKREKWVLEQQKSEADAEKNAENSAEEVTEESVAEETTEEVPEETIEVTTE